MIAHCIIDKTQKINKFKHNFKYQTKQDRVEFRAKFRLRMILKLIINQQKQIEMVFP